MEGATTRLALRAELPCIYMDTDSGDGLRSGCGYWIRWSESVDHPFPKLAGKPCPFCWRRVQMGPPPVSL